MVDKALCKSTEGRFSRSIACREGKVVRVNVYSIKNKIPVQKNGNVRLEKNNLDQVAVVHVL